MADIPYQPVARDRNAERARVEAAAAAFLASRETVYAARLADIEANPHRHSIPNDLINQWHAWIAAGETNRALVAAARYGRDVMATPPLAPLAPETHESHHTNTPTPQR